MNKKLLLFWQNPMSRRWLTVGLLEESEGMYSFRYSKSAREAAEKQEFEPFGVMRDLYKTYTSKALFPIFKNRLLEKSRPEYSDYLGWLSLDKDAVTDMDELSRSGGVRATDKLQLFPYPEPKDGKYIVEFFVHGIRHVPSKYTDRIETLRKGDALFLLKDVQNKADSLALAVRTEDPPELIGYCPRFFAEDFNVLLDGQAPNAVKLTVFKVNMDAPLQLRLMCRLESPWIKNFATFADVEFETESRMYLKVAS